MSDLPVKTQSFEDRFMDKLREAMGAMMTEDELRKLIERGVEKFLFEPRRIPDNRGYGGTVEKPPLLQELLEKHLHDRMSAACAAYLKEDSAAVKALIEQTLQEGLAAAMVVGFRALFRDEITEFARQLAERAKGL
jgi:hypothetical protein